MTRSAPATDTLARQRIDKWIWHARVVRTRTDSAKLVSSGHVRLNGGRMRDPAHAVKPGDVLTIALDNYVRVLRVEGFAERRGGADEAKVLFSEIAPSRDE